MVKIDIDRETMVAELQGSLLEFCKVFYPLLTGRDFIISQPIGREAHAITISRALSRAARLQIASQRLIINVPPGHGKSTFLCMWVAWTLSKYPDSRYLYISYSKSLAAKHTETIKRIIGLRHYKYLFDVSIRWDSKAKEFFQTTAGGSIAAFGSAGAIVGQDGGLPGLDRFSGAIICFPYHQIVRTEIGAMCIGDIVTKKIDIKVWSYNLKTKIAELKHINKWFENSGSDILKITLSDGSNIECTPCHKVLTRNGWIKAKDLRLNSRIISPSPNSSLRNTNNKGRISLLYRKIFNNANMIIRKKIEFRWMLNSYFYSPSTFGFSGSSTPPSNSLDVNIASSVFNGQFFCAFIAHNPMDYIFSAKSGIRMCFTHLKCSKINSILHVIRFSSVTKIFEPIIMAISIFMSYLNSFCLRAYKSPAYHLMDTSIFVNSFSTSHSHSPIFSFIARSLFFNFAFGNPFCSFRVKNDSVFTSNISKIRNRIKTLISRDRTPLFIENIGHVDKTYCLEIQGNHNFLIGCEQYEPVIVSNCDDLHKIDEVHSESMRENVIANYKETIQQRARGVNVPYIYIGQRVHEADLAAYLLDGKDGYEWEQVILKSIDAVGNALYPEAFPLNSLLIKEQTDPYVFASQFQQNPIPASGGLFKPEWFVTLDEDPEIIVTFITCDTAETSKSWNDASVFSFWGIYEIVNFGKKSGELGLHWLDCTEIRIEPKDLKDAFIEFYTECTRHRIPPVMAAIEKKSTGVTLVSVLKEMRGITIREIERTRSSGSKTQRFLEIQPYIANKLISFSENAKHKPMCIKHMTSITANESHKTDDICDTAADAIRLALIDKTVYSIDKKDDTRSGILSKLNKTFNDRLIAGNAKNYGSSQKIF